MRNTYTHNIAARLLYADGTEAIVTIPDHVADDQKAWDGRTFRTKDGRRVRLDGEAYGLHTPGTGDMTVRPA